MALMSAPRSVSPLGSNRIELEPIARPVDAANLRLSSSVLLSGRVVVALSGGSGPDSDTFHPAPDAPEHAREVLRKVARLWIVGLKPDVGRTLWFAFQDFGIDRARVLDRDADSSFSDKIYILSKANCALAACDCASAVFCCSPSIFTLNSRNSPAWIRLILVDTIKAPPPNTNVKNSKIIPPHSNNDFHASKDSQMAP